MSLPENLSEHCIALVNIYCNAREQSRTAFLQPSPAAFPIANRLYEDPSEHGTLG
jgi:hypothetical protein